MVQLTCLIMRHSLYVMMVVSAGVMMAVSSGEQAYAVEDKNQIEFKLPEGLEWETNLSDPVVADQNAKKGGTYHDFLSSFPVTFRQVGPNSNSSFRRNLDRNSLGLLGLHPNTLNFYPVLATHWAVAKDNKTVYYKLNKNAKWSDGKAVEAEDYTYTLEFMRSSHIQAPWYNNYYTEEISKVVVHSPDVISVVSGHAHIKKTLLSTTSIRPTHRDFYKLDGDWVKNYNWKVAPVTGAYTISSWKHGKFVTFKKVKNWWGQDLKYSKGMYNFDTVYLKVIRDQEAVWQNFIAGKLSSHGLTMASYYHEKARGDVFDKGYVKKLWFYTDRTAGSSTLWINQSREPWNDVNVRRAFHHALHFDKVNKELLRSEYVRLPAFYVGFQKYDHPELKARAYDIKAAADLMKKAGWQLGENGFWQKDGQTLTAEVLLTSSFHQDRLILLKEEAKKAGFDIVINLQKGAAGYKQTMEKNYDISWSGFGVGTIPPPSYWQYFHSKNAKRQTNNLTMTASAELDKLIDEYRATFDEVKRQQLSRQILQFIHDDAAFIPGFVNPFERYGIWRHIKLPQVPGTKLGLGVTQFIVKYGWIDEEAQKELTAYQKKGQSFGKYETIDETYRKKMK